MNYFFRVEAVPGSKKEMIPLSHGHSSQIVLSQVHACMLIIGMGEKCLTDYTFNVL